LTHNQIWGQVLCGEQSAANGSSPWITLAARLIIGKKFAIFFPIMAFVAIGFEQGLAKIYFMSTGEYCW